jgi:23S rRNA (uracil1939-C5)-methyltransferase
MTRKISDTIITVEVEKMIPGGYGLAHRGKLAVFIPHAVPGDKLRVRLLESMKGYSVGEIEDILEPSPARTLSPCPLFPRCGGCQWRMVGYKEQLAFKRELVREAFARQGGIRELPLEDTRGMEHPRNYRNKVIYPLKFSRGEVLLGYYERGTHRIVDLITCPVELGQFDRVIGPLKDLLSEGHVSIYDERRHTGKLRHLILRGSERTGETLVLFVVTTPGLPGTLSFKVKSLAPEEIVGVAFNVNPRATKVILGEKTKTVVGRGYYREKVRGLTFRVSATSFFQVNTVQAERLLGHVEELTGPDERDLIVDAYCGVGLFSLGLAHRARRVVGVEETASSVYDARVNAKANSLENVEFTKGRVEEHIGTLGKPDLVVLDPPRKGLEGDTLKALSRMRPRQIIYISCNPVTLARDARTLLASGYDIATIVPYDFFPHTYHVETLALFVTRPREG